MYYTFNFRGKRCAVNETYYWPFQPPELRHAVPQVAALVPHFLLWQLRLPLNLDPSLQPQSKGLHSLPELQGSPGLPELTVPESLTPASSLVPVDCQPP